MIVLKYKDFVLFFTKNTYSGILDGLRNTWPMIDCDLEVALTLGVAWHAGVEFGEGQGRIDTMVGEGEEWRHLHVCIPRGLPPPRSYGPIGTRAPPANPTLLDLLHSIYLQLQLHPPPPTPAPPAWDPCRWPGKIRKNQGTLKNIWRCSLGYPRFYTSWVGIWTLPGLTECSLNIDAKWQYNFTS